MHHPKDHHEKNHPIDRGDVYVFVVLFTSFATAFFSVTTAFFSALFFFTFTTHCHHPIDPYKDWTYKKGLNGPKGLENKVIHCGDRTIHNR